MKTLTPINGPILLREVLDQVLMTHPCAKLWPAEIKTEGFAKALAGSGAIALATWDGERWDGLLTGFVAPDFHSGELWGYESLWVVRQDADPDAAASLQNAFEEVCKARGCQRVVSGMFLGASRSDKAMRRMYRLKGYRPMSESFIKEL